MVALQQKPNAELSGGGKHAFNYRRSKASQAFRFNSLLSKSSQLRISGPS